MIRWLAPIVLVGALSGCGLFDTHKARDPDGSESLVGWSAPDLIDCAGKPDAVQQTGPDTAVLEWTHVDTSSGLKVGVTLLGSIQLGGGGGCKMVATLLRDGTVADVTFPGSYSNNLFSPPYNACEPLVAECLAHPGSTAQAPGYDAFTYLLATTPAAPGGKP